jgi:hypothetical protein
MSWERGYLGAIIGEHQDVWGVWRQVAPDRHFPALSALALADGDHALSEADILDTKLHKLGGSGAGFQQCLQHQPGAAVLGVCPVKKTQLFLDGQPIDIAQTFRDRPQPGAFPRGFELKTALLCA